jgi:hypothetical protein
MKALEEAMKVSLIDVFWLQERWKFHLKKRITPKMWIGKEGVRGTKPHRAIFWLESGEELPELQDDFLHVDIEWEFVSGKHPQELEEIDRSKPLPIDFIISSRRNNELIRAGRDLGIPVVSLSSYLKIPHKGRRIKLRF